jgi:hypothetical protein
MLKQSHISATLHERSLSFPVGFLKVLLLPMYSKKNVWGMDFVVVEKFDFVFAFRLASGDR